MNLKFLLQPTINKICAEVREEALAEIRGEGRKPEGSGGWPREWVEAWIAGWEEERAKNTKAFESWLQEQVRSGKITLHECLELPVLSGNYPRKHITVDGEIRDF